MDQNKEKDVRIQGNVSALQWQVSVLTQRLMDVQGELQVYVEKVKELEQELVKDKDSKVSSVS